MGVWEACKNALLGSPEERREAAEERAAARAQEEEMLRRRRENRRFAAELRDISSAIEVSQWLNIDKERRVAALRQASRLLQSLLEEYPHRTDWADLLDYCTASSTKIVTDALEKELENLKKRALTLKTKAGRINNVDKAMLLLQRAEEDPNVAYPPDVLARWRGFFTAFTHQMELYELLLKADKAEFKGEWKKALSAYQDVLYFLKRDHIPDDEQEDQIAAIEKKIAEMRKRIPVGKRSS